MFQFLMSHLYIEAYNEQHNNPQRFPAAPDDSVLNPLPREDLVPLAQMADEVIEDGK